MKRNILVIGQNRDGELGLGHKNTINKLTNLHNRFNSNIKNIYSGQGYKIYADPDRQCYYASGNNLFGQCCIDTAAEDYNELENLTEITYFNDNNICIKKVCVSIEGSTTFWISNDNKLYGNGSNYHGELCSKSNDNFKFEPCLINNENIENSGNIIDVQIGNKYNLILSHFDSNILIDGWMRIYFQSNKNDTFIPNDIINLIKTYFGIISKVYLINIDYQFKEIKILKNKQIISIKAGLNHCLFLESNGIVWSAGDDTYGQRGNNIRNLNGYNYNSNISSPTKIKYFIENKIFIQSVECGGFHCFAMDSNNKIYSWGWNGCGQCGHGNSINVRIPKLIDIFKNDEIQRMQCGESHCYVATKNGNHYLFGSNQHNECITNDGRDDVLLPHLVNNMIDHNNEIQSIHIGRDNTIIFCNKQDKIK